jgi:hypothetical protein
MYVFSEDELNQIESRMDANDIPRLVCELRRVRGTSYEARVDRARGLAELLLPQTVAYHNHKETMAHAGIALELALFVAIMFNPWPPLWVPDSRVSARLVTCLAFVSVWLLIHIFIRWELRGRRSAALHHGGLLRILRKWVNEPPDDKDLEPYRGGEPSRLRSAKTVLDFLVPVPSATISPDEKDQGYPRSIVEEWQSQKSDGTRAGRSEVFLFVGSVVILISVLMRTFWGK